MSPHPYSYNSGSESDERISVFYKLAWITLWLSVAIYFCFVGLIQPRIDSLKDNGRLLSFLLTSPSALGVFYLLYKRTCHRLWRNKYWRSVIGITAPDLNGRWMGNSVTYYPNGEEKKSENVELTVMQSWRDMIIGINGNFHKSDSMDATLLRVADGWIINFHYIAIRKLKKQGESQFPTVGLESNAENDPAGRDPLGHHTHIGSARLFISDRKNTESLKLQFFTEHARIGHMEFWKAVPELPEASHPATPQDHQTPSQSTGPSCSCQPNQFPTIPPSPVITQLDQGSYQPIQEQSSPRSPDA